MYDLSIKKNKKALMVAIMLFVIVGFLAIMMVIGLNNVRQISRNKEQAINNLINAEWSYIRARINENYNLAQTLADEVKYNIVSDIEETYDDNKKQLRKDLESTSSNKDTKLIEILGSNIEGIYLNDIKNDNNDPFILSSKSVLSDLSLNCSANGRTRTFDEEISIHFNKSLAEQALKAITMEEKKEVFWCFIKVDKQAPWYDDVKNMNNMDVDALKALFLKYKDYNVLASFEFISTSCIYDKTDIVGNAVVKNNGTYNEEAKQLFVNSGFNIVDIIDNNVEDSVAIHGYEKQIAYTEEDYERTVDYNYTFIFIECIAAILTFIALARLQNTVLTKE